MATETVTRCDVCSTIKKDVNHWWKAWIEDGVFNLTPSEHIGDNFNPRYRDVCGKGHALEMFNRYLETGQIEKPVSAHFTEQED